ncbi:MAG: Stp1/IreP family PP2C-type Ser/Thr phosphatase [Clostridia bacterium]
MNTFFKSDVGKIRTDNQDFGYCTTLDDGAIISIVCDGMGGVSGGRVASEIAVKSIYENIKNGYKKLKNTKQKIELLKQAIDAANKVVYDISTHESELSGMGTTVVLTFVENKVAHILHVGDSRAYLIRNNEIKAVTKDHSFVQEMLDIGQLSYESAKNHPKKNIITRALGVLPELKTDYNKIDITKGDKILICTDGLTNEVSDEQILEIVNTSPDDEMCSRLINTALTNGGADNITVAIIA